MGPKEARLYVAIGGILNVVVKKAETETISRTKLAEFAESTWTALEEMTLWWYIWGFQVPGPQTFHLLSTPHCCRKLAFDLLAHLISTSIVLTGLVNSTGFPSSWRS